MNMPITHTINSRDRVREKEKNEGWRGITDASGPVGGGGEVLEALGDQHCCENGEVSFTRSTRRAGSGNQ